MQKEEKDTVPGSALKKQVFISQLKDRDEVHSSFLVRSKRLPMNKNGKPYLALELMDKSGQIEARVWENAEAMATLFEEGEIVVVVGRINVFQGRMQLIAQDLVPLEGESIDLHHYLPSSEKDLDKLYSEMLGVFRGMKNEHIRNLGVALLTDPEIAARYRVCPAGKTVHHAYIGGLLEHSLQIVHIAQRLAPLYPQIDEEILIFGAAFHDFGKIYELSYTGDFGYTTEGRLVGHISIACALIDHKIRNLEGFPSELAFQLKHLVLSHHGKLEYGSPKKPATLEAQMLHHIDDMDSKLDSITEFIKKDKGESDFTPMHRMYDQSYYKPEALRSL